MTKKIESKTTEEVLASLAERGIKPTMKSDELMALTRGEGKTGEEVADEIAGAMSASYLPEDEPEPAPKKAKRKTSLPPEGQKSYALEKRDFWARREVEKVHDILRMHVLDMLDLAGWEIRSGKDSTEFRTELRELIEKRFKKGAK